MSSQDAKRSGAGPVEYAFPVVPRYAEIDQQGVVFNGHYLTWFDEAFTGFLDHVGIAYPELIASGTDVQVVHSEIDYRSSVRWRETVRVVVRPERVGTTSFVLAFEVRRRTVDDADEEVAIIGHNVYVCVDPAEWTKRPLPEALRAALARR